jgi:putative redox protein
MATSRPPSDQPPPPARGTKPAPGPSGGPKEQVRIQSGGVELEGHLAHPESSEEVDRPAVVLLHGFPSGEVWADRIGADLPELANRIAEQMGWTALAIRFRGCGSSTGDFSLAGWKEDVRASVDFLRRQAKPDRIWLVGFGTGGAVALVTAVDDPGIEGVAMVGSPADFADWAANPNRLLAHAKQVGAISSPSFPDDPDDWKQQLNVVRADQAAERLPPKTLLVLHGSEDELVPHFDARIVADAHGGADLRFIQGGAHLLRHDPRAVAVLLGWLGRQRASLMAQDEEAADNGDDSPVDD